MQTAKRRFEPAVIERLFAQPYRFQFFQAVRLLELWLKRNGMPHEGAVADFLRFQNSIALDFAPSQIESLLPEPRVPEGGAGALGAALRSGTLRYVRITPAFMGFLGVAGALPSHYTESIAGHQLHQKDEGPRAFLDTFSNRALALFYEAWRKYRLELKYQLQGKDQFLPLLLSLAGLGNASLRERLADRGAGVLDESIGFFAAAMRQRPPSAPMVARVLSDYFGQSVTLTQFIGCWYDVPREQQSTLGANNAVLGATALVGARVWQRDLCLRLTIGPLAREHFNAFLPGGASARALEKMLAMFTGLCLEYEVQLVLRAADVQGICLDAAPAGGRLGWDTFLLTQDAAQDRADVRYELHALA